MKCMEAKEIFYGKHYRKLEDYLCGLSVGKSNNELRKALRNSLNNAAKIKAAKRGKEKELLPGLLRVTSLLQVFLFKSTIGFESNIENMIPDIAYRCIVGQILGPTQEDHEKSSLESFIVSALRTFVHEKSPNANRSLADNYHEIVMIIQDVIDEL